MREYMDVSKMRAYLEKIPLGERAKVTKKIHALKEHYAHIKLLFTEKEKRKAIDDILFSFDNLPIFGKEYWFMKFTSNDGSGKQLLCMFGRGIGDKIINGKYVEHIKIAHNEYSGYLVCWAYSGGRRKIKNSPGSIKIRKGNIEAKSKNFRACFRGSFPKYRLAISSNGKTTCDLAITEPNDESPSFELSENYRAFFGYGLANLYFDFSGELFKKGFTGKCYVQKVIVAGPFIPWRWGRVVFSNGSILSYYITNMKLLGSKFWMGPFADYYDATSKKTYHYTDVKVRAEPCKGGKPEWILTCNKKRTKVCMKSYGREVFRFQKGGSFKYTEYLVEATECTLNLDTRVLSIKDVGAGFGMVEDTSGYVF